MHVHGKRALVVWIHQNLMDAEDESFPATHGSCADLAARTVGRAHAGPTRKDKTDQLDVEFDSGHTTGSV